MRRKCLRITLTGFLVLSPVVAAFFATGVPAFAQTLTNLYTFKGGSDGSFPSGALLVDQSGNIYGTTMFGGVGRNGRSSNNGTVFELLPSAQGWTLATLHDFQSGPDGDFPTFGVIADAGGNLYGTTSGGTPSLHGTVFQLVPPATSGGSWTENVIYRFHGSDGAGPSSGLVIDKAGTLYGTTSAGGTCGWGVAFQLSPPSVTGDAWKERILFSFENANCQTAEGGISPTGVAFGPDGALYGTTIGGGSTGFGIAFRLRPPLAGQSNWIKDVIYTFSGGGDGGAPSGRLVSDSKGNFYGTASYGGIGTRGTVFELSPPSALGASWTETTLYSFTGGDDGASPLNGVTFDNNGNLFGTTEFSLVEGCGCGTVFELLPPTGTGATWMEKTLHHFTSEDGGGRGMSGLVVDRNNALYGVSGGTEQTWSHGIVFQILP